MALQLEMQESRLQQCKQVPLTSASFIQPDLEMVCQ